MFDILAPIPHIRPLVRLNYAIDMRYGVLHTSPPKFSHASHRRRLGHVNFIWQGDASAQALRCLAHCDTRPRRSMSAATNPAGRDLAGKFGALLGRDPTSPARAADAWLTDTSQATKRSGLPIVDTDRLIGWTADWVARSMPSLGKPTKYEVRDGSTDQLAIVELGVGDALAGLALSRKHTGIRTKPIGRFFLTHGPVVGVRDHDGHLVATAALLPIPTATPGSAWCW